MTRTTAVRRFAWVITGTFLAIAARHVVALALFQEYVIGPDDRLLIRSAQVQELHDKQFVVSKDGFIDLPMAGRFAIAGLGIAEAQLRVARLFDRYYYDSQVSIQIDEYRSQPVSVLGAVTNSGVYQLEGRKTLAEVLSLAGGLRPEAGYIVRITRQEQDDERILSFDLRSILNGGTSPEEALVQPHDIITVPRAELVYVIGDVHKPGGFALGEKEQVSVLQALALAEGPASTAALKGSTILRINANTNQRTTINVDVQKLLAGKTADIMMQADDILVVPSNSARKIGIKTAEAALQTISGLLIWRRP